MSEAPLLYAYLHVDVVLSTVRLVCTAVNHSTHTIRCD